MEEGKYYNAWAANIHIPLCLNVLIDLERIV